MSDARTRPGNRWTWRHAVASFGLVMAACGDTSPAGPPATLALTVAPLTLEDIGFACYDLEVVAITGTTPTITTETVWRRGDPLVNRATDAGDFAGDTDTVCSNVFGNGPSGDIFYVGPCDATYGTHLVRVVVDGLYKPSGARLMETVDWFNPCPPAAPCDFYAECQVNADTPVEMNLTVVRTANQGFFDIGVRFDEIFCSAKVDCSAPVTDALGTTTLEPLRLVHNGDGVEDTTAVIAVACTAGVGADDPTELHLNAPRIDCPPSPLSAYHQLPLDIPEGYAWDTPPASGMVFQYGVYYGSEALLCGGEDCNKKYFNVAVGIDPTFANCQLAFEATASRAGVIGPATGWATPPGAVYPVLRGRVNLTPDLANGGNGTGVCGQNPLEGAGSGMAIHFTDAVAPSGYPFCYHLDAAGTTVTATCLPTHDYSGLP
jgi:hypothetical protein